MEGKQELYWGLPGQAKSHDIHEKFRKTDQLQGGTNEGWGDDIVDEKGTIVGQEDTFPTERLILGPQHNLRKTLGTVDGRKIKLSLLHTNTHTHAHTDSSICHSGMNFYRDKK